MKHTYRLEERSLSTQNVPHNVCQAKVLEFWYRASGRRMRVAAERIREFRGGSHFSGVYKKKVIS